MRPLFYLSVAVFFALPVSLAAQDTDEPKIYRNEIGTDVTSLINQILFVNATDNYQGYEPIYYLTYKRILDKFNLRLGIGGNSISTYNPRESLPDKIDASTDTDIDYRIGIEKAVELTKRWSFYYGLDFRHTISKSHDDHRGTKQGWGWGENSHGYTFAFAPNMTFEFKINKRLSLQTQANFSVYFQRRETKPFYFQYPDNPSSEIRPVSESEVYKQHGLEFAVPNFIIIAVRI